MAASTYKFDWWSKDEEGGVSIESPITVCATSYTLALELATRKADAFCESNNKTAHGYGYKRLYKIKPAA